MKILWFTWKDQLNPLAGGAEVVNEELATRLVRDGHEVKLIVSGFPGTKALETVNDYEIIRVGNRFSVYWHAYRYYRAHLLGWADLVIDEINTMPFFAKFYVKEPNILFVHMLCREIWFHELPKPLGLFGYLAEPAYLRMLSSRKVITVSESTKKDLIRFGFKPSRIQIISEGIKLRPLSSLNKVHKYEHPTLLSLGSIRSMKRTLHQIEAFELAKRKVPDLKLKIAGPTVGTYGRNVLKRISTSQYANDIEYLGRVSEKQKTELLQRSLVILQTALKEGWGLTVTEAASQSTPAIAYNADGLRDSVRHNQTGLVVKPNPKALSDAVTFLLKDKVRYDRLRLAGWQWSKEINFDRCYEDFNLAIKQEGQKVSI